MENETLRDQTKALFDEMESVLMDMLKMAGISITDISNVDDDVLIAFKKYIGLLKKTENLAIAQAEQLDKLDKLIEIETKIDKIDHRLAQMK